MRASPTPRQFGVVVAVLPKRGASPTSSATTPQLEEGEVTNGTAVSAEELPTIQACLEALSRGSGSQEIESGRLPRTAQMLQVPYVHVEVKRCSPPSSVVKEEPPLSERIEALPLPLPLPPPLPLPLPLTEAKSSRCNAATTRPL